ECPQLAEADIAAQKGDSGFDPNLPFWGPIDSSVSARRGGRQASISEAWRMADMEVIERPPAAKPVATRRPELAGPRATAKPLSFFAALRAMSDNPLATIPVVAYEQSIWKAKSIFGNQLFVSDPAGIKRVLLDNVANYPKAALDIRILSTAFGDGLLSSDGDKWRAHR